MSYSSEKYLHLFNKEINTNSLDHNKVQKYRTKTIKSGDVLEVEIYPIWNTRAEIKKAKNKATRTAQKNLNDKNAKKRLIRKVNANFTKEDIAVTLTYKDSVPNEEQARKDIQNYIRRIRNYRRKHQLSELKYIYVIEFSGEYGTVKKRVHHHVIMSGMDRDAAEQIWGKGWANCRRLQPNEFGFEALARYMVKEPNGGKRWCCSRNLQEPVITVSDTKISKRRVQQMAEDFKDKPYEIFSKVYPKYEFNSCEVLQSAYVAGAYIYAKLHRRCE